MFGEGQEVWKVYPEYPWIEASNLGNVRTKDRMITDKNGRKRFVKGRALTQQLNNKGYMYVLLSVNGKNVCLLIHRIVATCFIPNPNGYPEVNHIDNNPTNNTISNLEWCSRQYNEDYKKNFGTTQADISGLPVFAVDLKTGKVLRFKTRMEAARQLGIPEQSICVVANGKQNTAGGLWFTEDENKITREKIQEIKDKMYFPGGVIAVNLDSFKVFWFESQHEASRQLGINAGHINEVIKGKRNKAGSYWFTYADENAIEKIREKFGDEIAKKVEKLMCKR